MRGSYYSQMTEEQRQAFHSLGGRTAQAKGTAHRWTPEEASAAGRKGAASRAAKLHQQRAMRANQE